MPHSKPQLPWSAILEPAPGPLELVQAFLNTLDLQRNLDELKTSEGLKGWLVQRRLVSRELEVTAEDSQRVREVRDALRALIRATHAGKPAEAAVTRLNQEVGRATVSVLFDASGETRFERSEEGVEGALGHVLAAWALGREVEDGARFKICDNAACRRAYWDRSSNRSGRWCSKELCGNRFAARAHRKRVKAMRRAAW